MNRDYQQAMSAQLLAIKESSDTRQHHQHEVYRDLADLQLIGLRHATPFFWNTETTRAVVAASKSVPGDTKLSAWNLPTAAVWWYFEEPLLMSETIDHEQSTQIRIATRALLLFWIKDAFVVMPWADSDMIPGAIFPCSVLHWPLGLTLDNMATSRQTQIRDGQTTSQLRDEMRGDEPQFILAALAWLEQKIATDTETPVHRARRREFERITGSPNVGVRVVQLRRAESHSSGTADPSGSHFSVRWVVDGHWRHQPCGHARADRRLTWIHPYLKGPDGAPLHEPRPKVYAVVR
jgi:hypothetical protein